MLISNGCSVILGINQKIVKMDLHYAENILKEFSVIVIFIILLLSILFCIMANKGLPPGPWGIPFFGYWFSLRSKSVHLHLQELMKTYGEIYSFSVTGKLYIHLGSIKAVREAYVTKSDCFTGRTQQFTLINCFFSEGVASANGEQWKVLRKFFIQTFREYGVSSSTGSVYDSLNCVIANLRAATGKPVEVMSILTEQCSAILRRVMFNDEGITAGEMLELTEAYVKVVDIFYNKSVLLSGNFAKHAILPLMSGFKNSLSNYNRVHALLTEIIKRHYDTFDEQNIRNIIDSYFKEKNDRKIRNDSSEKYFTDQALLSSLLQFLGDGVLGVAEVIGYFIHVLLQYPDEQEKICKELDDVIGPDREPFLEDKNNLPYTNGFMLEVVRLSDFVTIFPSLECTKETTLAGYRIPKGAISVTNFWASHRDPKVYEEPYVFKPSRFLRQPGKGKAEQPIMFGVGKRACAGETFTMMQVFLFVTTIVKNFRLVLPEGVVSKDGQIQVIAYSRMNN